MIAAIMAAVSARESHAGGGASVRAADRHGPARPKRLADRRATRFNSLPATQQAQQPSRREIAADEVRDLGHAASRQGRSHHELYRDHLDEIALAETLGFDHYWIYEHHLQPSAPMPAPNLVLAAAAQRTSRIRLGNMVNVVSFRNPLLLAEEAALLDALTNGRLDLGLGRGSNLSEYRAFGIAMDQSRAIFEESVGTIRASWPTRPSRTRGDFSTFDKRTPLSPPLVQQPHPPIYITAASKELLRWAAERDLPAVQLDSPIDDCRRDIDLYRSVQTASGHVPAPRLCLTREIDIAETDDQARREAYPHLLEYWNLWGRYTQFTQEAGVPGSFEPGIAARRASPRCLTKS